MPAITCTPAFNFTKQDTAPSTPITPKDTSQIMSPITATSGLVKTLIVDDNTITARMLSKILQKEFGHSTSCTESGKDALARLSQEVFDVIFMDIDMPELSGIETTIAIHSQASMVLEQNKRIPIIAYTTNPCDQRYFEAGMNGWVSKPANQSSVRMELERVCTTSSSADCKKSR